jgi:hypothetical protein
MEHQCVLCRENLRALIAGESLDLLVNRLLMVLQRSVGGEFDIANVADGFELVVVEVVCDPLLLVSIFAVAELAGHARGCLLKVLVGRFSRMTLQSLLVLLELIIACESLVAVDTADVCQVVEVEDVLVE